jgi:hypothetical protein
MGANERIILIKGDADKWYNQAIFIVNKDLPDGKIPVDFVAEAEKIINNYLKKQKKPLLKQPSYYNTASGKNAQASGGYSSGNTRNTYRNNASVKKNPGKKKTDFFINMCMMLGCLMLVAALTLGFMG